MAVFKPKTRIVSFRLSEEEYECLRQKSLAQGAHSVSDYARVALCRLLGDQAPSPADEFEAKVAELDEKMQQVERELQRLARTTQRRRESDRTELLTAAAKLR
jgi:hypothetical protein